MPVSSKQRETTCAHQVYNALGYNDPADGPHQHRKHSAGPGGADLDESRRASWGQGICGEFPCSLRVFYELVCQNLTASPLIPSTLKTLPWILALGGLYVGFSIRSQSGPNSFGCGRHCRLVNQSVVRERKRL